MNTLKFFVKKEVFHQLTGEATQILLCGWVYGNDAIEYAIEYKRKQRCTVIVYDEKDEITRYTVKK